MECVLVITGRRFFTFKTGTNSVQVKVIAAVIKSCQVAVDISPISTSLGFLIKSSTIGTEKSKILNLKDRFTITLHSHLVKALCAYTNSSHFNANMEHLTLSLRIGIVSTKNLIPTSETCLRHIM